MTRIDGGNAERQDALRRTKQAPDAPENAPRGDAEPVSRTVWDRVERGERSSLRTGTGSLVRAAEADLGPLPFEPGESRGGLSAAEVEQLAREQTSRPSEIRQLAGRDTCAAAEAQFEWADANPDEYTRVARELLERGEATIVRNGREIVLSVDGGFGDRRNSAWIDAQDFSPMERLNATMQAALMNHASGHPESPGYDLAADRSYGGGAEGNSGVSLRGNWRLGDLAGGEPPLMATSIPPDDRNAGSDGLPAGAIRSVDSAFRELQTRLAAGQKTTVLVTAGNGEAHMARVVGLENGLVRVRTAEGIVQYSEEAFRQMMDVDTRQVEDGDIGSCSGPMASGAPASATRSRSLISRFLPLQGLPLPGFTFNRPV